jgi:hypothetical protein
VGDVSFHPFTDRLALLEGFLSRTEIADAAQYALQWLGDVLGIRQSLCLVRERDESAESLVTIAAYGLDRAALSFSVSVNDWNNPLVHALSNRRPAYFGAASTPSERKRRPSTPLGDAKLHVIPLGASASSKGPVGLLVLSGAPQLSAHVEWLANVLALKLIQIRGQQAMSEGDRRQAHER